MVNVLVILFCVSSVGVDLMQLPFVSWKKDRWCRENVGLHFSSSLVENCYLFRNTFSCSQEDCSRVTSAWSLWRKTRLCYCCVCDRLVSMTFSLVSGMVILLRSLILNPDRVLLKRKLCPLFVVFYNKTFSIRKKTREENETEFWLCFSNTNNSYNLFVQFCIVFRLWIREKPESLRIRILVFRSLCVSVSVWERNNRKNMISEERRITRKNKMKGKAS
jgi:hypothetical protein